MTRNNLDSHLSWLLRSLPSNPPSATSLPPASLSVTSTASPRPETENRAARTHPPNVPPPQIQLRPTNTAAVAERQSTPSLDPEEGGRRDMTKLRAMAGSTPKPTLVSMSGRTPTPKKEPKQHAGPRPKADSNAHSSKFAPLPRQYHARTSEVEIMDLTDVSGARESPITSGGAGLSSSRKRKSSEFDHNPSPSRAPQRPKTNEYAPRDSGHSFTAIDDIPDEELGPPPPYSTMAPANANMSHSLASKPTKGASDARSVLPDSENEADDEEIFDITRQAPGTKTISGSLRERLATPLSERNNVPSGLQNRQITSQSPLRRSATKKAHISPAKESMAFSPSQYGNAKSLSQPLSISQADDVDVDFLKQIFGLPADVFESLLSDIDRRREAAVDNIAEKMDQGLEEEAVAVDQEELDKLDIRYKSVQYLGSRRGEHGRLVDEKNQLYAALRHAIKAKQGVDDASDANMAGKTALHNFERSCWKEVNFCREVFEDHFRSAASNPAVTKSFAVESTQALPVATRMKINSGSSPERVVQTPLTKSHKTDQRGMSTRLHSSHHKEPSNQALEDFTGFGGDDMLGDGFGEECGNRMGTAPLRSHHIVEDDFGMEDDDEMLELENARLQEPPRAISQPSRPVLQETSANRRPTLELARKNKPAEIEENYSRFPWYKDLKIALRERFHLKGFRQNQLEAISATLQGLDAFVLMPTGGGKSLCYQLPALITSGKHRGVTFVVSPLLALMEDQVQHLRRLNIQAFLMNGDTGRQERVSIMEGLREPDVENFIQLLYITPEMLSKSTMMENAMEALYRRNRLARIVVDECHCVSSWGHDFRADYLGLAGVRNKFPNVPVMALTATATPNCQADTIHNLGITGCQVFKQSFNRPNLYYEVRQKSKGKEHVQDIGKLITENHKGQTGIIYCLSRNNCETMAEDLRRFHRIKAEHYHAGMEAHQRAEVQQAWQAGRIHVTCCTIAFGMGIHADQVRYVIHANIPKSLEGYYQETGRAGRDGKPANCYLFFTYADAAKLRKMIDDGDGAWEEKERQRDMLRRMSQFCSNKADCRRQQVLEYFNETFDRSDCKHQCDNCNSASTVEDVDVTGLAMEAVKLVKAAKGDNVTMLAYVDAFRGVMSAKIREKSIDGKAFDELDGFGAGSEFSKDDVERLFYRLIMDGALRQIDVVNKRGFASTYTVEGHNSGRYQSGRASLTLQMQKDARGSKAPTKKARELPTSTNVSSPVEDPPRRKRGRSSILSPFDYGKESSSDDSDGFEPIRTKGHQKVPQNQLGPPISHDNALDALDKCHQIIVHEFVAEAKRQANAIMLKKNLRNPPFTDTILRKMIIGFKNEQELMDMPGVNPERAKIYGKQFCDLVRKYQQDYVDMVEAAEQDPAAPADPHARNVIDLVSDNDEDYGSLHASDLESSEDDGEGQPSAYFEPPVNPRVKEFNARLANSQATGMGSRHEPPPPSAPSRKSSTKSKKPRNYTAKNSKGGGSRRSNEGGISKKGRRFGGSKSAGGRSSASKGAKKSGHGISMMPT